MVVSAHEDIRHASQTALLSDRLGRETCATVVLAGKRRLAVIYVVWLPGQVSNHLNYTPVLHPRTGEPLTVPALIVPDDLLVSA